METATLLSLLILCFTLSPVALEAVEVVHITNNIGSQLVTHCVSLDDDLGRQALPDGGVQRFSFGISWSDETKFTCQVEGGDKIAQFVAFDPVMLPGTEYDWYIKEDGGYLDCDCDCDETGSCRFTGQSRQWTW